MNSDEIYMNLAISQAWKTQTLTLPNPAVACLILHNNEILALESHQKSGFPHAEVLACKSAFMKLSDNRELENIQDSNKIHEFLSANHNNIFKDCEFFVTLEPCNHYGKTPPCAKLLEELKPKRIIIGTNDTHKIASGGAARLKDIEVSLVLSSKAESLLYPFKCLQRGRFNLFKIASRLDGSYEGGIISNEDSRIFTHNMRAVADSITISGRTLRDDNPFLDTRYALPPYKSNKNPKIYIFSKNIKDISSYNIKNREVEIVENLNHLQEDFNIIEGGFSMLSNVKDSIDCIMGYIAPSIRTGGIFHQTSLDDFYLAHCDILEKEEGNIRYWLFRK